MNLAMLLFMLALSNERNIEYANVRVIKETTSKHERCLCDLRELSVRLCDLVHCAC